MAIIREEQSFSPINAEKTTINLDIWRFNFGWLETKRIVYTGETQVETPSNGIIKEEVEVGVSGDGFTYNEQTFVVTHPPSFLSPETGSSVSQNVLPTYRKKGTTHRTSTSVSLDGTTTIYDVGSVKFDIAERKEYAVIDDAEKGKSFIDSGISVNGPTGKVDSSVTLISANGVKTITHSKG